LNYGVFTSIVNKAFRVGTGRKIANYPTGIVDAPRRSGGGAGNRQRAEQMKSFALKPLMAWILKW